MNKPTTGVIGAGAWGTALAQMLSSDGREVVLWAYEPELIEAINADHRNPLYLPDAALNPTIRATGDLADFAPLDIVLGVTPAQVLGKVLGGLPTPPRDLVLCSKGIEAGTGRLMNEVARAEAHCLDGVFDCPECRHDDDLRQRRGLTSALQHFEAAYVAHPQVRDHQVVAALGHHVTRGLAVGRLVYGIAFRLQDLREHPARTVLIVDDENPGHPPTGSV